MQVWTLEQKTCPMQKQHQKIDQAFQTYLRNTKLKKIKIKMEYVFAFNGVMLLWRVMKSYFDGEPETIHNKLNFFSA